MALEYPLVLGASAVDTSFCLHAGDILVAHANFLQRSFGDVSVALVGNVVTKKAYQGRGAASFLLNEFVKISVQKDIKALFLWSDLDIFYQKIGFSPVGKEVRVSFTVEPSKMTNMREDLDNEVSIQHLPKEKLTLSLCREIKKLLPVEVKTIERTAEEFLQLLKIPNTNLYLVTHNPDKGLLGYFIVGKGHDMKHVIHEWGGRLVGYKRIIHALLQNNYKFDEVIFLCPEFLKDSLFKNCKIDSSTVAMTQHHVALGKIIDQGFIVPENFYLWGLDSI